jgi:hypothetical protein
MPASIMPTLKRTKRIVEPVYQPTITDLTPGIISNIIYYFLSRRVGKVGCTLVTDTTGSYIYTTANSLIIVLTSTRYPNKYMSNTMIQYLKVLHLRTLARFDSKTIRKKIIHSYYYTSIRKLIQSATNDEAVRKHILIQYINTNIDSTDKIVTDKVMNYKEQYKNNNVNVLYQTLISLYKGLAFTCHEKSRRGPFRKDILLYFEKEMKSMYETLPQKLHKQFEYYMLEVNVQAIMLFRYPLPDIYLVNKFINANKNFPFLSYSHTTGAYKIKDSQLQVPQIAVKVCDIQVVPVIGTIYKTVEDVSLDEQIMKEKYYHVGDSYCLKDGLKVTIKPIKANPESHRYFSTLQISVIALNHTLSNTNWKSILINDMNMFTIYFIHRDKPDVQLREYPGDISSLFSHLKTNQARTFENIILKE